MNSILCSIQRGYVTRTKIMYRAYLSYSQLIEYLKLLEESKLAEIDDASQTYSLTEKGFRFIKVYEEINELVPGVDRTENEGREEIKLLNY
jgi:predicted transcriptional regulator